MARPLPQLHSVPVANVSLAGLAAFGFTALAVQWMRVDLDWVFAPLSFYLVGAYGALLKTAYAGLALSLTLIGLQFFRALRPGARSDLAPWLFGAASVSILVTAFADTHLPGAPRTTSGYVHAIAAPIAFLAATVAMLLQSWHLRYDPAWRHRFAPAFALALACFAGLWIHALVREWPRGLTQRCVIASILAWLCIAAAWLRSAARTQSLAASSR